MNPASSRLATLMGSASLLTMMAAITAHAQQVAQTQMMAQAAPEAIPEQVLITGSLIHGTAAVGVPVTNLGAQDFTQTGNITIGDLFRTVPAAIVEAGPGATNSGGHQERETRVNIRGLDQTGPRSLLMVDGVRFPPQADGICAIDPSIIPSLALDRVDILADGASATYGSDAIAGVINVVLKRGYDGAVTLLHAQTPTDGGGGQEYQASQLYGRTWDGGDITLTYEYLHDQHVVGTAHSNYTMNYTPWGLDNPIPIGISTPGTISTGKPNYPGVPATGTACSNCFAVPKGTGQNFNAALNNGVGPLLPSSAATLNWPSFATTANMHTNLIDPLKYGWEDSQQDKNSFVATFDQRLFPGISFFATGFYSNRRVDELRPLFYSNGVNNEGRTFVVPTINPYYPTGAPSNLRVSYELGFEVPPVIPAYELSYRYQFGLNIDLPFGWTGQIYDSRSYDSNKYVSTTVNLNSVSVALGNTMTGTFGNLITKPAAVPYLNLFCDPRAFQCNSPTTLNYIKSTRFLGDIYQIEEKGGRFDGPLFDIPGGQIKAAVGGTYESDNVYVFAANNAGEDANTGLGPPPLTNLPDSEPYAVWAGFVQLDIPVFGDNFNIPLIARRLDLEGSWRHDQYHGTLNGGTSNPKIAFTWLINDLVGATVRGSWGTSFRFANAGEYSTIASDANGDFNLPGQVQIPLTCDASGNPTPGSVNQVLHAAGFACNSTNAAGITWAGGPHPELRSYTTPSGQAATREGGTALAPEKSNNYSIGIELAPQIEALRGLDLQATWYSVKINGTLLGFNGTNPAVLSSPSDRFHLIVPSDLGCPVAANANPTTCAPFEKMAAAALLDRNSPLDISFLSSIYWINDGSTVGTGFTHVSGIDWNASYDIDLGDFGAWNAGITGTYYLHRLDQTVPGTPIVDELHTTFSPVGGVQQAGVTSDPRMRARARLG
ncbi:MAG: TonB-dependent receptor, partial [Alphaproteobacteria bacterium]|nr:TonB-dependent receptor [Alphaproteobacteria bacterium]